MSEASTLRPAASEALAEWARRVRANREQVDRVREVPDGPDFYAPVASRFQADPYRRDDPTLNVLRTLIQPGEVWLDIGAGGGRYALPIALGAREVIALDPSIGMLQVLRNGMAEYRIGNVRIIEDRWPLTTPGSDLADVDVDVAMIANVGYDIEDFGPFLEAMERTASSRCVAILRERPPAADAEIFWQEIHGEARVALPSLPEFLALQLARGRLCEVRLVPVDQPADRDPEHLLVQARRQTWVEPGGAKDRRLEQLARERARQPSAGERPTRVGIVTWTTS